MVKKLGFYLVSSQDMRQYIGYSTYLIIRENMKPKKKENRDQRVANEQNDTSFVGLK